MICVLLYHLKSSSTCKISKYLKLDILNFLLIIPIYLFLFIFIYFLLISISLEWGFFWAMFFHFAVLVLASQLWWMVRYFSKGSIHQNRLTEGEMSWNLLDIKLITIQQEIIVTCQHWAMTVQVLTAHLPFHILWSSNFV